MIQQTSRDAYESVNRADDTLYDRVLNCIYDNGAMTCDEVEVEIGGRHQSVSSRIRKGVQDGYLVNSGAKRRTRTGRKAIVWIIADRPESSSNHEYAKLVTGLRFNEKLKEVLDARNSK